MYPALVFLGLLSAVHAQRDFMTKVETQLSRKQVSPGGTFSVTCLVTVAEKFLDRKKREARAVPTTAQAFYGLMFGDAEPSDLELDSNVLSGGFPSKAASASFSREVKEVPRRVRRQSDRKERTKLLSVMLYRFQTPDSSEAVPVARYGAAKKAARALVSRHPPLLVTGEEVYSEVSSWGVLTTNLTVTFQGARCADAAEFQCSGEVMVDDYIQFITERGQPVHLTSCRRCGKGWC